MTPAAWPRREWLHTRLLRVDPGSGSIVDGRMDELPAVLRPGDVLVVNDAATLPASLLGRTRHGPVEVRLAGAGGSWHEWQAVLFGAGTWRLRTEDRPAPPTLEVGDRVEFDQALAASVEQVSSISPRLVTLRFEGRSDAFWSALYRIGRPIQYSYLCGPLALAQVQTAFATRPWSVEMPSAGRALTEGLLRQARHRGIAVAAVTHAAGLSATGDPALDAMLPMPERYEIPALTVGAVQRARASGGRVVAVGTTVVRALEGSAAANGGVLSAGTGTTDLRLGPGFVPAIVDGILTGAHEPGTSHFELLRAFAPGPVLEAAYRQADAAGYLGHEFGDAWLVLGGPAPRPATSRT